MLSPFTGTPLPNSTLYFPDPSAVVTTDNDTGNIIIEDTVVAYQAYLRPDETVPFRTDEQGIDHTRFKIKGRLVNPMNFPVGFLAPLIIRCDITLESGILQGELELEATIEPILVAKIAGQKLQGIFRFKGDSNAYS